MTDQHIFHGLSSASAFQAMGVDGLRVHVIAGTWRLIDPVKHAEAVEAIRRADASAVATSSAIRDAREARTLAIAEDALSIAKDANRIASEDLAVSRSQSSAAWRAARYAMYAAAIAAVAAIAGSKDQILALIFGHP